MDDEALIRVAIKEAVKNVRNNSRAKFSACVAKDGKLVVSAHNTTHLDLDVVAHGEINAIRKAYRELRVPSSNKGLKGYSIYSTCEPCIMCFGVCKYAGIKKIVYGISLKELDKIDKKRRLGPIKSRRYTKEGITMVGGVLRDKCAELFKSYPAKS